MGVFFINHLPLNLSKYSHLEKAVTVWNGFKIL
nr:MAG TPA: hypothetical protein [Caudoviricetes sp.]